jgi:hypothetical protein
MRASPCHARAKRAALRVLARTVNEDGSRRFGSNDTRSGCGVFRAVRTDRALEPRLHVLTHRYRNGFGIAARERVENPPVFGVRRL